MKEVIESAKKGNIESLRNIYSLFKKQIYYFCSKLITDPILAKELTTETFLCAWDKLDTLEDADKFEVWLKNIAAIKCFNYIHKMKPMLFLQSAGEKALILFSETELNNMEKDVALDETKSAAVMDMMFSRLDDAQRMTLMFHYYIGLSLGRIAKIMNCSGEMVKGRMEFAAESMKTTLNVLLKNGIELSAVDFRTVLQLSAACVVVPPEIDQKMEDYFSSLNTPEPEIEEEKPVYSFDNYIPREEEPGEFESSVSKYTDNEPKTYNTEIFKTYTVNTNEKKAPVREEKSTLKQKKTKKTNILANLKTRFRALSVTQQSVALLISVGLVAIIILAVAIPNRKDKIEPSASSSTPTVSSTESVASAPVVKLLKVDIKEEKKELKSPDDTVIALASYQLPIATISEYPEAQQKINKFFEQEKEGVISFYDNAEKKAECELMYSQKAYGEWKKNEYTVKMLLGKITDKVISIEKSSNTFVYGNVHSQTSISCYNFSTQTGEQLKIEDVMKDADSYYTFATNYITAIAEAKQNNGDFDLYSGYTTTISNIVRDNTRWYFTDKGIKIIFEEDELVYITYGAQSVEIPYSELQNHLKEEYMSNIQ